MYVVLDDVSLMYIVLDQNVLSLFGIAPILVGYVCVYLRRVGLAIFSGLGCNFDVLVVVLSRFVWFWAKRISKMSLFLTGERAFVCPQHINNQYVYLLY